MIHQAARVPDDDRWAWECTCGAFLTYDIRRIKATLDDHLSEEVSTSPVRWKHRSAEHIAVKTYASWVSGDCPICAAAQKERASAVAWLRGLGWIGVDFADAIARGEHLRADDE